MITKILDIQNISGPSEEKEGTSSSGDLPDSLLHVYDHGDIQTIFTALLSGFLDCFVVFQPGLF